MHRDYIPTMFTRNMNELTKPPLMPIISTVGYCKGNIRISTYKFFRQKCQNIPPVMVLMVIRMTVVSAICTTNMPIISKACLVLITPPIRTFCGAFLLFKTIGLFKPTFTSKGQHQGRRPLLLRSILIIKRLKLYLKLLIFNLNSFELCSKPLI